MLPRITMYTGNPTSTGFQLAPCAYEKMSTTTGIPRAHEYALRARLHIALRFIDALIGHFSLVALDSMAACVGGPST